MESDINVIARDVNTEIEISKVIIDVRYNTNKVPIVIDIPDFVPHLNHRSNEHNQRNINNTNGASTRREDDTLEHQYSNTIGNGNIPELVHSERNDADPPTRAQFRARRGRGNQEWIINRLKEVEHKNDMIKLIDDIKAL